MTQQHTPEYFISGVHIYRSTNNEPVKVAMWEDGFKIQAKDLIHKANTQPDLLEACEALLKRNMQLYAMVEYPREDMSGEASLKLAKAAILKAKGGQK